MSLSMKRFKRVFYKLQLNNHEGSSENYYLPVSLIFLFWNLNNVFMTIHGKHTLNILQEKV